jgi:hypothetical protein
VGSRSSRTRTDSQRALAAASPRSLSWVSDRPRVTVPYRR